MRLDQIARKARLESLPAEEDICDLIFDHGKTTQACRIFLGWLKDHGGSASRHEISRFGWDLETGKIRKGFTYSRRNFYRCMFRRLVDLGFIALTNRFEERRIIRKYAPIIQPIPTRPPSGHNFFHLIWQLCEKWNQEWRDNY